MNTYLSEDLILQTLSEYFPEQHNSLLLGRGDDCSVLAIQNNLCISTDLFVEDVHFRTSYFNPQEIGHKALAVNISDIAAMGARPVAFSLGLAIPPHIDIVWLKDFFSGMAKLANAYKIVLSGGDISRSEKIFISISIWGETTKNRQLPQDYFLESSLNYHSPLSTKTLEQEKDINYTNYLTRGGAMPGDMIFLIGEIGLARVGLAKLEKYGREALKKWPNACLAHLLPSPQVDAGLILARSCLNARQAVLMDVSDGLARDLPRLLGIDKNNSLGAEINLTESMLHEEVVKSAKLNNKSAIKEAWLGGEDYALVGAITPKLMSILKAAIPSLYYIGSITNTGYIELNGKRSTNEERGFDHFQPST